MRAVQIALLVMSLQVGMGLVTVSGLFGDTFYEEKITGVNLGENPSALSEEEQTQVSIDVMNKVWNALTWGWLKNYFQPLYNNDALVKSFVDYLILFMDGLSGLVIGVAFIEFVRNRINVL